MIFGVIFLIFVTITIPSSLHFWHSYQHVLATCSQASTCDQVINTVFLSTTDVLVVNFVKLSLLGIPLLLGLFWGVPLIAKEYADNTNKLVWTQGISRREWLTAKLAWALLMTALYAGAFSALATWFSRTGNAINGDRFASVAFSSQGIVPVTVAIFAVAVGIAFGAWFKKLLPAFGATLGLLMVLQVAVPLVLRPHYQPAQISAETLDPKNRGKFAPSGPTGQEWILGTRQVNNRGQILDTGNPPQQCMLKSDEDKTQGGAFAFGSGPVIGFACLSSLGYHWEVKYQPAYRYWNFQRIEATLYLSLTSVSVAATYWLVLKRDA